MKNSTLKELLIGIGIVGIVFQILCLILFDRHLYHAIGLWTGIGISFVITIHMQRSIEDGLDIAGDAGVKHMKTAYLLRTGISVLVMATVMYYGWGNPLTILLGIMALKIAVYLQPVMHKVLEKQKERR